MYINPHTQTTSSRYDMCARRRLNYRLSSELEKKTSTIGISHWKKLRVNS